MENFLKNDLDFCLEIICLQLHNCQASPYLPIVTPAKSELYSFNGDILSCKTLQIHPYFKFEYFHENSKFIKFIQKKKR